MSDVVIKVEDVWKQYRLGVAGSGMLGSDIKRLWYKARGQENPEDALVEENDRSKKGTSELVWALKGINFEVKRGEVLGIVGKNGAGKSTLLKILSRVTAPTKGEVKIQGRIASLLEVGTGFHPDLTGRENIYMNGAILGMRKAAITKHLDEIIAFSGVERYIDTPVKRYSSGMYVRLAFAVAAHLDPEILILDEVLAVGDAEFQKKCLGKMKDVSEKDGRTVLFVSHNLSAVATLCNSAILLEKGLCILKGDTNKIIGEYLNDRKQEKIISATSTNKICVNNVVFKNPDGFILHSLFTFKPVDIELHCESEEDFSNVSISVCFDNPLEQRITSLWSAYVMSNFNIKKGNFIIKFSLPEFHLAPGEYKIVTYIEANGKEIQRINNYMSVNVGFPIDSDYNNLPRGSHGVFIENYKVTIEPK